MSGDSKMRVMAHEFKTRFLGRSNLHTEPKDPVCERLLIIFPDTANFWGGSIDSLDWRCDQVRNKSQEFMRGPKT